MRRKLLLTALISCCSLGATAPNSLASSTILAGSTTVQALSDGNQAGNAQSFLVTAGASGTPASLSLYVGSGTASTKVFAGVYTNANGHPSQLIASGNLSSPHANAWNTVSLTKASNLTASTKYWIAVLGVGGVLNFRDTAPSSGVCSETSPGSNLTGLPSTWSPGTQWSVCSLSAYVSTGGATPPPVSPPANTAIPVISGSTVQGSSLSSTAGTWSGSPTAYVYQWQDCSTAGANCTSIAGATASTYTATASDVGHTLRTVVTATNSGGSASASSTATAVVTAPSTSSSALFGTQTVQPNPDSNGAGTAQAFSVSNTSTATAQSINVYVDTGSTATSVVAGLYADNGGHPGALLASGSISSPSSGAWHSVPIASTSVAPGTYWLTILGTNGTLYFRDQASGTCTTETSSQSSLTSMPSTWSTGGVWSNAYCPVSAYVSGTATASSGGTGGGTGGGPAPTAPSNTTLPSISGSTVQGQTLIPSTGSWNGSPTSYTYQWQDCDTSGTNCAAVSGATAGSYTLASGDVGHTIRVVVTAANTTGSASATSAQTAAVTASTSTPPSSNSNCAGTALSNVVSQSSLDACGYPSMNSTGPAAGTAFTSTNGFTASTPGQVYNGLNVSGGISITANNVTIENSNITDVDPNNAAIQIAGGVTGVKILNDSIHGTNAVQSGSLAFAVSYFGSAINGVTIDHTSFYNGDRILAGYGTVTNSYCLGGADFTSGGSTEHDECIYTGGGAPGIRALHDTLINANPWQTAAIFVDNPDYGGSGSNGTVDVENSLLAGGDYCLYGGAGNAGTAHSGPETILNNRFARLFFSTCGQFGPDAYMPSNATFSGNVWDDNNQAVS